MAVVAAIGASSYLNLDQGDLEQDTAMQAKKPESKHLMPANVGQTPKSVSSYTMSGALPQRTDIAQRAHHVRKVPKSRHQG
jgi:hypothetical protein